MCLRTGSFSGLRVVRVTDSDWEKDVVRCLSCGSVWDELDPEHEVCGCAERRVVPVPVADEHAGGFLI